MKELVSIVIAAFNEERYIFKCIDAALKQTYSNIEVIVVNDGSNDKTLEILNNFNDSRLKVIDIKKTGKVPARNLVLEKTKGKYILFQDADDWSHKKRVETLLAISQKIGSKSVVGSNYSIFNEINNNFRNIKLLKNNKQIRSRMRRYLMSGAMFPPSLMVQKKFLLSTGPWREKFNGGAEDGDLVERLFENGAIFHNSQSFLYTYRLNEGSSSIKFNKKIPWQMFKRFCKFCRRRNIKEPETFEDFIKIKKRNIFSFFIYKLQYFFWFVLTYLKFKFSFF